MTTWAWGRATDGSLGIGAVSTATTRPTAVLGGIDFIDAREGALFLTADGHVYFAGVNSATSCLAGDGTTTGTHTTPVLISALSDIARIDAGRVGLALDNSGNLWGWGQSNSGSLGIGVTTAVTTPTIIATNVADFATGQMPSSTDWCIYLDKTGAVYCAGYNGVGNFGIGTTTSSTSWVLCTPTTGTVKKVACIWGDATGGASAVLMADGSIRGAGANDNGWIGAAGSGSGAPPITTWTQYVSPGSAVDVWGAESRTFWLGTDGKIWTLGGDLAVSGSLAGDGSFFHSNLDAAVKTTTPAGVGVVGVTRTPAQRSPAFLGTNGLVYTWGDDNATRGDGTNTGSPVSPYTPASVNGLTGVTWVAGGINMFAGNAVRSSPSFSWVAVIG